MAPTGKSLLSEAIESGIVHAFGRRNPLEAPDVSIPDAGQIPGGEFAKDKLVRGWEALMNPTKDQLIMIGVLAGCFFGQLALANIPYVKYAYMPFKLMGSLLHEFGHVLGSLMTCSVPQKISLNPRKGSWVMSDTRVEFLMTAMGPFLGSVFGALFVSASFNIVASKIASLCLAGPLVIMVFWAWSNLSFWLCIGLHAALIGAAWFFLDSEPLKYVIMFLGVLQCTYVVNDFFDDRYNERKEHYSDSAEMPGSELCWVIVFSVLAIIIMVLGLMAGMLYFPETLEQQLAQSNAFAI